MEIIDNNVITDEIKDKSSYNLRNREKLQKPIKLSDYEVALHIKKQ